VTRPAVLSGLVLWAGAALVFTELRWFRRPSLADRLRPYLPGGPGRTRVSSPAGSVADVVAPVARRAGERLARLLGVGEDLELRLTRLHSPVDASAFRVRQVGTATLTMAIGALAAIALGAPAPLTLLLVAGAPLLVFVTVEQRLGARSTAWQRRVFHELPVVAEQLALLLSAGWSLTAALDRISARGSGAAARDLARVCRRVRQGVGEAAALQEWAVVARIAAVDRLVAVLALDRHTGDLGRLVTEEARTARRDAHRELVETVERRNQQVWIPVTVATLLPGSLFMGIPFIEALRMFGT